jgi:ribonuclease-3
MPELEETLGYAFSDPELLQRALTHRSLEAEDPSELSNERLEFLGDAVLGLIVAEMLHGTGTMSEGSMAKVRAAVVDVIGLSIVARRIDLGAHLRLGRGEAASGGSHKASILADTMEAVIGAIYLDGGLEPAQRFIVEHWRPLVDERSAAPGERDYKTRLQEVLAQSSRIPEYESDGTGPDHAREFVARVSCDGDLLGQGHGTSKKRAEQEAARHALEHLLGSDG